MLNEKTLYKSTNYMKYEKYILYDEKLKWING